MSKRKASKPKRRTLSGVNLPARKIARQELAEASAAVERVQQAVRDGKMASAMKLPAAPQLRMSDALLPVNEFEVRR